MDFNDPRFREIFFDIHRDLPREGPGSLESARRALGMIPELPDDCAVLDVGCGPGRQTIHLAQLTRGRITAVDNHQPFLDQLTRSAVEHGFEHRITPLNADMNHLDLPEQSFDLVWSEGALYQMGFANGLRTMRHLLKPGGYLAASEAVLLKDGKLPPEVWDIWKDEYPVITTIEKNLELIQKTGYEVVGHFTLPEDDWLEEYYAPMEKRLDLLEPEYADDPVALEVFRCSRKEIEDYRNYSDCYGYEFFVCGNIR
jgi:SAM-dependent methyltransferase